MQEQYTAIAPFYDALNDVDYDAWCDFLEQKIIQYGKRCRGQDAETDILDLACGTGAITLRLAKRGYDMIGVDLSADMLCEARKRAQKQGQSILWLQQDMRSFELYGTVDVAVCCLDSLNYLLSIEDWKKTFSLLHNYLNPDGLLIFDVRTRRCMQEYAKGDIVSEAEGVVLTWQSDYHKKTSCCDFYLSFFCQEEDGRYTRYVEHQRQRAFAHTTIKKALEQTGFALLQVCSDFEGTAVGADDLRRFYICKCQK